MCPWLFCFAIYVNLKMKKLVNNIKIKTQWINNYYIYVQLQLKYDETNDSLKDIVQETCLFPELGHWFAKNN